jgi:hypothetical protein
MALLLLAATQLNCGNAGEDLGFGVRKAAGLKAFVYFDRDASGDPTAADTTPPGIEVRLLRLNATQPSAIDTTEASDTVRFTEVDPGYYVVIVDSTALGDSIVATRSPTTATVQAGGQIPLVRINLAPPVLTLQGARAAASGKVVIVGGVINAGRQSYGDGSAYLEDPTGSLRIQGVTNLNGNSANQPGDVVRVRGTVAVFNGQPVLTSTRVYLVGGSPEPPPDTLTTGQAASANAGSADASEVRVLNAVILDTTRTGPVFVAGVNDGSGRLEIRIDPLLFATTTVFALNSLVDVTGVLVPTGLGAWQLWPRTRDDYVVH